MNRDLETVVCREVIPRILFLFVSITLIALGMSILHEHTMLGITYFCLLFWAALPVVRYIRGKSNE